MTDKLILYTTKSCSRCQILKKILDTKNIVYTIEENIDKITEKAREVNTQELPILVVKDSANGVLELVYSGSEAVMYGKSL